MLKDSQVIQEAKGKWFLWENWSDMSAANDTWDEDGDITISHNIIEVTGPDKQFGWTCGDVCELKDEGGKEREGNKHRQIAWELM